MMPEFSLFPRDWITFIDLKRGFITSFDPELNTQQQINAVIRILTEPKELSDDRPDDVVPK
jgi:hypothetical protein